jgi:hypothetical protein
VVKANSSFLSLEIPGSFRNAAAFSAKDKDRSITGIAFEPQY